MGPLAFACIWIIVLAIIYLIIYFIVFSYLCDLKTGISKGVFAGWSLGAMSIALIVVVLFCILTYYALRIDLQAVKKALSNAKTTLVEDISKVTLPDDFVLDQLDSESRQILSNARKQKNESDRLLQLETDKLRMKSNSDIKKLTEKQVQAQSVADNAAVLAYQEYLARQIQDETESKVQENQGIFRKTADYAYGGVGSIVGKGANLASSVVGGVSSYVVPEAARKGYQSATSPTGSISVPLTPTPKNTPGKVGLTPDPNYSKN